MEIFVKNDKNYEVFSKFFDNVHPIIFLTWKEVTLTGSGAWKDASWLGPLHL